MTFSLTDNPLLKDPKHPCVQVAGGEDPVAATRQALAGLDLSPAAGRRVLVKPNAGRMARAGEGITTDPRVVGAVLDALVEAGATVEVGESPIIGVNALEALEATGIAAVARARGCGLVDLDVPDGREVKVPEGRALSALTVCAGVLDYDLIVSVPVMKVHMHTGVTLSVKNMKGCLWRRFKAQLHMLPPVPDLDDKSLNIAIADMASVLRPHLSVVDGTVGMEGMGPSAGKARALGAIVVSADPFAADAVSCVLMGRKAEDVPHLRIGAERGYGVIDLGQMSVTPDGWQDWAQDFEAAPDSLAIEFPNVRVHDNQSCSSCQSTLLLFLQRHAQELTEYFPSGQPVDIAIGKGHKEVPEGTLCIGNCTACHRERGLFVPGCPPVGSQILQAIKDKDASGQ